MDSSQRSPFDRPIAIHVRDSSLMGLVVAGIESYHVRDWGNGARKGTVETAGLLWGYVASKKNMDHVVVDYISTDTYAKRTANDVTLNDDVTEVKQRVIELRWPHLTMLGDFHTHPYENVGDVPKGKGCKGWEFSKGDREWYEGNIEGHSPTTWPGRIALVLTIAELGRSNHKDAEVVSDNVICWQMDKYRFWLAGYSIDPCGDKLLVSPASDTTSDGDRSVRPTVYIDAPTVNGTDAWFNWG